MDMDQQAFSILSPYSRRPTNQNRMNNHHPQQSLQRQYTTAPEFRGNYGNEPSPSMLQNTPQYSDSSRTIKEEHDLNPYYLYSAPTQFRGELNVNMHHPTQGDPNPIRYPASHNAYPSDLNSPNAIRMASSRLETPEARLTPGPAETGSLHFRHPMHALQPQHLIHPQRHQHGSLPHHQHQNHVFNHIQGGSPFFTPSTSYSSLDQEHGSPGGGGLDRQPQTQLEYDSREQQVSVSGMVYDSLQESMAVPGHPQQGVRRDPTLNHRGSLASLNSNNSGSGSYHTTNLPASSIPMSNNRGTASSMNSSMSRTSPSFSSRWASHPSGFDLTGPTTGTTSEHSQVPALSSTTASTSASSLLRPTLRHSESDNRSTPENSFTQDNFHLRTSTSAQTLSSTHSTNSHTKSPSPRLSDNEANIDGRHFGSGLFSQDDRESDQDVETSVGSAGGREVIGAGEEVGETFVAPVKRKKKSKMHCCEICSKKFPRPSGLRTHMNTHSNEKPYPCGFPGCTRSFGVRSNAKRHLRTHGVIVPPAVSSNLGDAPYIVGFCPPMIGVPQSSSHQLHLVDGGEDPSLGSGLLGDNANIHTQGQGQSGVHHETSSAPILKLRWMPQSLTTRTNADSLREVRDKQYGMGDVVEENEGEDDFVGGNVVGRMRGDGYGMDMEQEDMVDEGDETEFGANVPRLMISSSSRAISSVSPGSSTSFARSNNSLSPPTMSAYRQELDITSAGGGGVYPTRTENTSREYGIRENRGTEERNSYLETAYHPSQFRVLPGTAVDNAIPSATVQSYLVVGRK